MSSNEGAQRMIRLLCYEGLEIEKRNPVKKEAEGKKKEEQRRHLYSPPQLTTEDSPHNNHVFALCP